MKKLSLLLPSFASAQINYSGEINPSVMTRKSDQSQINLPFRIATLEGGYTFGSVDLKTSIAIEHRWNTGESVFNLREVYLAYYPDWGEVKFGKQIHAWGAVDGNNPTDNLNPYDYYYMFSPGTKRKLGTISFSSKIYVGNFQLEGIIIPKHEINRMPYGEKDFPLSMPVKPFVEYEVDREMELGFRVQNSSVLGDVGFAIFNGNDRAPSLLTANVTFQEGVPPVVDQMNLGYRSTTTWGFDFVTFIGDFTLRGESSIFKTRAPLLSINLFKIPLDLYELHQEVTYAQSVFQVEYTTASDITISGQYIASNVSSESYEWFHTLSVELVQLPNPTFRPGMGTPFAMFTDRAIMLSSSGVMMDDRMELKGSTIVNMDESGYMFTASIGYSPWINWKIETAIVQFKGEKDEPENAFTKMEDFSHLRLGLYYNF